MKNNKFSFLLTIIGLISLAAFIGACSSSPASNNTATTSGANKADAEKRRAEMISKAPQGASPANAKGAPNALVTIEEFADFQCPTCATMHPKVQEIRAAYGDRVRIIFREFPLQGHVHGYDAACAAEAAGLQGKFWEMQNMLFSNQSAWSSATDARKMFTEYAEKIGLDVQKFSDDMIGLAVKNRVDADLQRGRAVGVGSTPTFLINNKMFEGDLNSLKTAVEAELKRVEAGQTQSAAPSSAGNTSVPSNTTATNSAVNTNSK